MGKPCLFFKVNRVLDWEPVGFFSSDVHSFFTGASADQTLAEDSFCASKSEWCDQERSKSRMNSFLQSVVPVDQNPVVRCMQYSDSTDVRTKFILINNNNNNLKKGASEIFSFRWRNWMAGALYRTILPKSPRRSSVLGSSLKISLVF